MYYKPKIQFIILILLLIIAYSCRKKETYPVIPHIDYKSCLIYQSKAGVDSAGVLTISFTDGDGDIGRAQGDTATDFFINFFEKQKKELKQFFINNIPINFNSKIPYVTPSGNNKNIKGDISITLDLYPFVIFNIPANKSDTVAFQVYITDRSKNKSNVIMTPEIILRN
jgi:hypothetical protein